MTGPPATGRLLDLPAEVTAESSRWAASLGVPTEAVELYRSAEVIDLHLDTYIWRRTIGYRFDRRHADWPNRHHLLAQVDVPRAREGGLTGGIWSITTNPLRRRDGLARAFVENLTGLRRELAGCEGVEVVTDVAGYRAARARGHHGAFLGVQGGNALSTPAAIDAAVEGGIVRVTLVHLTSSEIGTTSSPLRLGVRRPDLGRRGRELIERLEAGRVLVDLAHISEAGFSEALDVHDPGMPLIVTHTGVDGVRPHWRNLTDDQIRSVAATGGCVGIILHGPFLGRHASAATVVDHLAHVVRVGGEGAAALGSDYDGTITPPRELARHSHWPRLVAEMQRRDWSEERIRAVLGGNALRTIEAMRP